MNTLSQPKTYVKAIYSGVLAVVTGLTTVLVGNVEIGDLTQGQWAVLAAAALVSGGGVYGLKNKDAT